MKMKREPLFNFSASAWAKGKINYIMIQSNPDKSLQILIKSKWIKSYPGLHYFLLNDQFHLKMHKSCFIYFMFWSLRCTDDTVKQAHKNTSLPTTWFGLWDYSVSHCDVIGCVSQPRASLQHPHQRHFTAISSSSLSGLSCSGWARSVVDMIAVDSLIQRDLGVLALGFPQP